MTEVYNFEKFIMLLEDYYNKNIENEDFIILDCDKEKIIKLFNLKVSDLFKFSLDSFLLQIKINMYKFYLKNKKLNIFYMRIGKIKKLMLSEKSFDELFENYLTYDVDNYIKDNEINDKYKVDNYIKDKEINNAYKLDYVGITNDYVESYKYDDFEVLEDKEYEKDLNKKDLVTNEEFLKYLGVK